MKRRIWALLLSESAMVATALMTGCGSYRGFGPNPNPPTAQDGSVVVFGTDAPICDVESFLGTITSASLIPEGGGTSVPLISATAPATVDFVRLTGFTTILGTASIAPGTYTQLQLSFSNPQLVVLDTSSTPPAPQPVAVTLTASSFDVPINPALVVTSSNTSGVFLDFNLRKSVQLDANGQITGTVNPQFSVLTATPAGSSVGEADSLYGIVQGVSTANLPSGFTGSFGLALHDGTGQTLTIYSNSTTAFEGDNVAGFTDLVAGNFVEVDAIVNTSGQFIAQSVDSEEPASIVSQKSALLGKVIGVTRNAAGNVTDFILLVDDEIPDLSSAVPLRSALFVNLAGTVHYFTNWREWNRQSFTFGPQTLGLAQNVAVFGTLGPGSTLIASDVFLRPRSVLGNFAALLNAGSDGKTGGFSMVPCGGLFGGNPITVVTYADTSFRGVSGLTGLTPAPTLSIPGLLFYEQAPGTTASGVSWSPPTWVMQARGISQLPN
jgi:hypothetical protein